MCVCVCVYIYIYRLVQYRDNDGTVTLRTIPVTCDQNLMEVLILILSLFL